MARSSVGRQPEAADGRSFLASERYRSTSVPGVAPPLDYQAIRDAHTVLNSMGISQPAILLRLTEEQIRKIQGDLGENDQDKNTNEGYQHIRDDR